MDNTRNLTLLSLQKALGEAIEEATKDVFLKKPGSGELVSLRAYSQELPVPAVGETQMEPGSSDLPEEESEYGIIFPFPWAVVKLDRGTIPAPGERQTVYTVVILGVFEDDLKRNGHEALAILLERIMERFCKNPLLKGQFTATQIDGEHMFNWTMQDEDTHPYYYAALEMAFSAPAFEREDPYGYA